MICSFPEKMKGNLKMIFKGIWQKVTLNISLQKSGKIKEKTVARELIFSRIRNGLVFSFLTFSEAGVTDLKWEMQK